MSVDAVPELVVREVNSHFLAGFGRGSRLRSCSGVRCCCRIRCSSGSCSRLNRSHAAGIILFLLADIEFDRETGSIALDEGSVDDGYDTVAVNIAGHELLFFEFYDLKGVAHDQGSVYDISFAVLIYVAEDIGNRRLGRSFGGNLVVLIDTSYAGVADFTLDLAAADGEGVAGDRVDVIAVGELVVGQADILAVGTAEGYDHRTGRSALDVCGAAGVSGAVFGLTDEEVMELVDCLGGSVGP